MKNSRRLFRFGSREALTSAVHNAVNSAYERRLEVTRNKIDVDHSEFATYEPDIHRSRVLRRYRHDPARKSRVRVLLVTEDRSVGERMRLLLGQMSRPSVDVHVLHDAKKIVPAYLSVRPDVVIADNWFSESNLRYWDAVMPLYKKDPAAQFIVLTQEKYKGKTLPTSEGFFHVKDTLPKLDILQYESVNDRVLRDRVRELTEKANV